MPGAVGVRPWETTAPRIQWRLADRFRDVASHNRTPTFARRMQSWVRETPSHPDARPWRRRAATDRGRVPGPLDLSRPLLDVSV